MKKTGKLIALLLSASLVTGSFALNALALEEEPAYTNSLENPDYADDTNIPPGTVIPFKDVKESSWYYEDVARVYIMGLMSGTASDAFSPDAPTERAMIVTVICRMAHYPNFEDIVFKFDEPCPFPDVEEGSWYENSVRWAAMVGIASGYADGTFRPHEKITRQELAQFVYSYAQFEGFRNMYAIDDLSGFSDKDKVGSWAKEAFGWAVAHGIMNGLTKDSLAPGETATRAQLASTMNRLYEILPPAKG